MGREVGSGLPPHVAAMLAPGFYPRQTKSVELVQTHISYVFLADDRVYKLKKPVRFSFLDFSTLAQRRHFCREEVRLNRRLAPDTYLGVISVVADGQGFRIGEENDPDAVEYAVEMRRLPAERMLPVLLARDQVTADVIEVIVGRLVDFHRSADDGPQVRAAAAPEAVLAAMDADFTEMARFRGKTITPSDDDAIIEFCRSSMRRRTPLLERRRTAGRVREGHGDLHAEHICMTDGVVIFDCIEFNRGFRCRDVAGEIAFLAMDLDYRGHPELSALLVDRYAATAGDADLPKLVPFMKAHRAYIRGKVDSLKSEEPEVGEAERQAAAESARRHFALAYRYTWTDCRFLVVVVGLSGSGKSTVAAALGERTGFAHFTSDVIRKQLAGLDVTSRAGAGDGSGLYSPRRSAETYARMLALARSELAAGRGVIVDATFLRRADRDAARALAAEQGAPLLFVECDCEPSVAIGRLRARQAADTDPSDADEHVYERQRQSYERFAAEETSERLLIDTGTDLLPNILSIEAELRRRVPDHLTA
jgi:aminoglycoside phosphotransferase family enzyme/predicted kinase